MKKLKMIKRALMSSILAVILCFTMLLGTTFAWFTDSVNSANNIIQSGTLDVKMEWKDATATGAQQTYKDASEGAIFNCDKWEPGYVEAKNIKISNVGTLALKYKLLVVANGEVSDLSDVIDVYYYDSEVTLNDRDELVGSNKIGTLTGVLEDFETTAAGTLEADKNHTVTIALKMQETAGNEYQNKSIGSDFSVVLVATQATVENDSFGPDYDAGAEFPEVYIASDVHDGAEATALETEKVNVTVPATAEEGSYTLETTKPSKSVDENGNTTVTMDITLKKDGVKVTDDGTVYTVSVNIGAGLNLTGITHNGNTVNVYSYDSATGIVTFDTTHFSPFAFTYDLGTKVESAEALGELIANGGIIQLSGNVELTDAPIVVKKGQSVVLNLNGYTLSGKSTSSTTSYLISVENGGELIIQDGTVSFYATTPDTEWGGEGQPPFPGYANNTVSAKGTLIVNNATIENKTAKGGASYAIDAYQGADVVVNDGSVINGFDKIAIRMFANSDKLATNVTINGGKVTGYRAVWVQLPGSDASKKMIANLTVNDGILESTDEEYFDAIYSYSYGNSFANTTITLNGGEFIGDVSMSGGKKIDRENFYIDWENCKLAEDAVVIFYTEGDPVYCVPVDTAEELKAALEAGYIATLTADITMDVAETGITVAKGVTSKLDLNGYDIIATSTSAEGVQLFSVNGTLDIVGKGTISLTNDDYAWTTSYRYTTINIREAGVVTLGEGVNVVCDAGAATEKGYGMNYAVDIYTTGTLNINGASLHSNYIAVRCFYGNSVVNVNSGSITSSNNNYGIWPQSAPGAVINIAEGINYTTDSNGFGIYIFG